jgi:hypothetical protein
LKVPGRHRTGSTPDHDGEVSSTAWTPAIRLLVAMGVVVLAAAACGQDGEHRADPPDAPGVASTLAPDEGTTTTAGEDPALALCLGAEHSTPAPAVATSALTEISGLVASRTHAAVLWAVDDSGGAAAVSAIGESDGADLGSWTLAGASNLDWEDLALGPGPDGDLLYVADIGDNLRSRVDVRVYRVAEPDPADGGGEIPDVDTLVLTYPDGAQDAESLFVDPVSGDLVVVTKDWDGGPAGIYRAPGDVADASSTVLEAAGFVDLRAFGQLATGADISADGSLIALRTYGSVLVWWRQEGTTVAEAMAGGPCEAPTVNEAQGETVAIDPDGRGYVTVSEGTNPPVNAFQRD